jgi:hypothetical protein
VAAPALPCLYENNCIIEEENGTPQPSEKVVPRISNTQKKRAFAVKENVQQFVDTYGINDCGFFTVTFDPKAYPDGLTPRQAQERMHSFHTNVLSKIFGEYVRVLEFHKDGRPHYHELVQCLGDIRTGFNWSHYEATRQWNDACKAAKRTGQKRPKKPVGSLDRNPLLKRLHGALNENAAAYGIGRCELVPIRSTAEAVGFYIGGYLSKSDSCKPASAKGCRNVVYSQGFKRAVKGAIAWAGEKAPGAWVWREKIRCFAFRNQIYGDGDFQGLMSLFGRNWLETCTPAILAEPLEWWPSVAHMIADQTVSTIGVPFDATDIRSSSLGVCKAMVGLSPAEMVLARVGDMGEMLSVQDISRAVMDNPDEAEKLFGSRYWGRNHWTPEQQEEYAERVTSRKKS